MQSIVSACIIHDSIDIGSQSFVGSRMQALAASLYDFQDQNWRKTNINNHIANPATTSSIYHCATIIAHIHHWSRNRIVKRITSLPMALPSSLSFNPALHPWIFTLGLGLFNVPHRLSQFFVWTGQGSTIAVNTALWAQTSCRHCMLPFSLVSATTTQQYIFISPQNICRPAMCATWSD